MKRSLNQVLFGRNALVSLALVAGIFFLVGFACSKSKDAKPISSDYYGAWVGDDGSTLSIRGDGSADYKSGGTSVSGGTAEINEADQTLSITFVGVGPTFKITKAPSGNQMTLDGIVYKKGGSSTSDSKSDQKTASSGDVPGDSELQDLVKDTIMDFNDAIQRNDFSDFHDTLSTPFQEQASPEKLASVFHEFVTAKVNFKEVADLKANFTTPPTVNTVAGNKTLIVKGNYATTPRKTNFELKYISEDDAWRLIGIDVNTKDE